MTEISIDLSSLDSGQYLHWVHQLSNHSSLLGFPRALLLEETDKTHFWSLIKSRIILRLSNNLKT